MTTHQDSMKEIEKNVTDVRAIDEKNVTWYLKYKDAQIQQAAQANPKSKITSVFDKLIKPFTPGPRVWIHDLPDLVHTGDVVLFSGANAHMAMSISTALSVTAYESFVNLHPRNLGAFLDSGTPAHYKQCRTRQPMLDDIKGDVANALNDLCEDYEDDALRDPPLEEHTPTAIRVLRRDALIGEKVAPLRPPRRRRLAAGEHDATGRR